MASTDATPSPKKNAACRITVPMYDNTGAHLSGGLSGLAAKITKDAGSEVSTTNTPVEIATNSSKVYLDLTSTEMNADTVAVVITCSNTNANPTDFVIYTNSAGKIAVDLDTIKTQAVTAASGVTFPSTIGTSTFASGGSVNATQIGGQTASASGTITFPAATLASTTNITAGTIATVTNAIVLPAIPTDWIAAAGVKADAVTKIQSGLATPTNITAGTITNLTNLPVGRSAGQIFLSNGQVDVGTVNGVSQTGRDLGNALPVGAPSSPGGLPTIGLNAGSITLTGSLTVSGTSTLHLSSTDQATIRSSIGLASANLDTQLANILDASGGSAPTVTEIRQEMDANSTKLAAIYAFGAPPSVSAIANQVNSTLTADHGAGSWQQSVGGDGLSGPSAVKIYFKDSVGNPVPLVEFLIETQGVGRSDTSGIAQFGLTDRAYFVDAKVQGLIFPRVSLTVSGTTTLTINAAAPIPPAPVITVPPFNGAQSW